MSPPPAADVLLARAATEPRAGLRMLAAEGLGRGRTEKALETLDALARDPVPGVRAAALRSLFALDTPAAITVRQALPRDARSDLNARRLRWHRLRGRASPALLPLALDSWRRGRSPEERTAAAQLLVSGALAPPLEVVRQVLEETGSDPDGAARVRRALGVPMAGYDAVEMRKTAIMAAWVLLFHPDAQDDEALRSSTLDRAVGWLASPVSTDPYDRRPIPETVLRMVLPDFGESIARPTMARVVAGSFRDPQDGVFLLTEALPPADAAEHLRALLDPDASPRPSESVRIAAAGALADLGFIGDEALTRRLLAPEEGPVIRRAVLSALTRERGAWAVPLLGEVMREGKSSFADQAVTLLESRDDPEARRLLIDHLFAMARHPYQRLEHLVAPGDDVSFEVLRRALENDRVLLRLAALSLFPRVDALRSARGLSLLHAYAPRARDPNARTEEYQQILYALFATAPAEGIPYARTHWNEFEKLGWAPVAMRSLQNLKAPEVVPALVDFVLERVGWDGHRATAGARLLREAAVALAGRRGTRDEELDDFWRFLLGRDGERVAFAAVHSLAYPGRGDLVDGLRPLLEGLDPSDPEEASDAAAVLDALAFQPWPRVEPILLPIVFDAQAVPSLRRQAARLMIGRVSPSVRLHLLDWLTDTQAVKRDPCVARVVARVVGEGGGAGVANRLERVLEERFLDHFAGGAHLDPNNERDAYVGGHLA
ncbi:MAG: HEAT repeat domain-containing protein, partial [Planctomycetota bacterium]